MIKDILVVDASAHSYNLREDNYAAGRYSQAVVAAAFKHCRRRSRRQDQRSFIVVVLVITIERAFAWGRVRGGTRQPVARR
jgi:hypothetical protein